MAKGSGGGGNTTGLRIVVRNPIEVANSLAKRNGLQPGHALGMWHYYNLVALRDAMGLPVVFMSYERLMRSWESELRRCAAALELDWPADDKGFRMEMDNFIDPSLRHNQSSPQDLQELPGPVRELYEILSDACVSCINLDSKLETVANRLWADYLSYASFFPYRPVHSSGWFSRTARRWQRSIRKRLPKTILFSELPDALPSSASRLK